MIFQGVPPDFLYKLPKINLNALPSHFDCLGVIGLPETGKTHYLTHYSFKKLLSLKEGNGVWTTATGMLNRIQTGLSDGIGLRYILDEFIKPELLLIDDLFASEKQMKSPGCDHLAEIISQRINHNRVVLWTSNLTENDIKNKCDARLASRLLSKERGAHILCKTTCHKEILTEKWVNSRDFWANWDEQDWNISYFLTELRENFPSIARLVVLRQRLTDPCIKGIILKIGEEKWNQVEYDISKFLEKNSKRKDLKSSMETALSKIMFDNSSKHAINE